jgi:hypothetical protein
MNDSDKAMIDSCLSMMPDLFKKNGEEPPVPFGCAELFLAGARALHIKACRELKDCDALEYTCRAFSDNWDFETKAKKRRKKHD